MWQLATLCNVPELFQPQARTSCDKSAFAGQLARHPISVMSFLSGRFSGVCRGNVGLHELSIGGSLGEKTTFAAAGILQPESATAMLHLHD